MPALEVRRFRPRDAERVRELHRIAIRAAGTPPTKLPDTSDLEDVLDHYVETGGEFLVGELDVVVATGGLRPVGDATAEIKRMRVHPDHQGRGFGGTILDELETAARDGGFERIVLDTAARQDSAGFYRTHGYREVDRREWNEFELVEFAKDLRSTV